MWVTDDFHLAATAVVGNDVFGGSLKLEQDGQIPFVVRHCIDQVEQRGLDVVGIYRLSGQSTSIQRYKALFNSSKVKHDTSLRDTDTFLQQNLSKLI